MIGSLKNDLYKNKTKVLAMNVIVLFLFSIASIFASGCASAEPITLRVAHSYSATHFNSTRGVKAFADRVTARTNGQVKFFFYPSGQLGKDQLSLLNHGVVDIALLVPSLQTEKFPLMSVVELPSGFTTSCEGSRKFWHVAGPGGVLNKFELQKNGVRALYTLVLPQYPILTVSRPISSVKDFSGIKLRANGGSLGVTFRALDAVPVQVGATDIYNAVSRGTVDGAYLPYSSVLNYSVEKEVHYSLEGLQLGSGSNLLAISEATWQRLPESVRSVMLEEASGVQEDLCGWLDKEEDRVREIMVRDYGLKVVHASAEMLDGSRKKIATVADQWVKDMSSKGRDGRTALDAFRQASGK